MALLEKTAFPGGGAGGGGRGHFRLPITVTEDK